MTNISPNYKEFAPPESMAHLIGAFWSFSTFDAVTQSNQLLQHRILPDGCMDLIFEYQRGINGEIDNPQLTVYGATDRFSLIKIKASTEFIGVRFNPGMAGICLKLNPIELFQQEAKAQDCSKEFVPIFDRLCKCSSTKQILNTLQISLLKLGLDERDGISEPIHEALRLISTSNGRMPVSQIAAAIGVSERTLRRGVIKAVGLSPKVLARIIRFQSVIAQLRLASMALTPKEPLPYDLCRIALESGYADQAHMEREFQRLSGLTPTTFIS